MQYQLIYDVFIGAQKNIQLPLEPSGSNDHLGYIPKGVSDGEATPATRSWENRELIPKIGGQITQGVTWARRLPIFATT